MGLGSIPRARYVLAALVTDRMSDVRCVQAGLPLFSVLVLGLVGVLAFVLLLSLTLCVCRRRGPPPAASHRAHRFFVAVSTRAHLTAGGDIVVVVRLRWQHTW